LFLSFFFFFFLIKLRKPFQIRPTRGLGLAPKYKAGGLYIWRIECISHKEAARHGSWGIAT
jgi:hypothetical protein